MIYRAAPASQLRTIELDAFVVLYHRPSGMTHLLGEPAPEILAALHEGEATLELLRARLSHRFDLAEIDALAARLGELVATGLVEAL